MSKARSAALVDAGVFLQLAGDLKGARDLFARALALDPQNSRAQHLLAAAGGAPPKTGGRPSVARAPAPAVPVAPKPLPPPVPSPPRAPLQLTQLAPVAMPPPLPASSDMYTTLPGVPVVPDPSLMQTIVQPSAAPKTSDSLKDLAEVDAFLRYGMYDKALEYVMRVLRADPENLPGHEKAYAIMLASGHRQLALEQLLNVLRLCAKRGDNARAQPYLETLRLERPDHPELPGFLESLRKSATTDKFAMARPGDATIVVDGLGDPVPPRRPLAQPSKKKRRR